MKDYYKILGVAKNATPDEIKKAFRRLAHQHHPDKPSGNESKFKEINEAYQVLSDTSKRSNYDQFGTADNIPPGYGAGGAGPNVQWDFSGFGGGGGGGFGDFGDLGEIFETMFQGGAGYAPRRRTYQGGRDLQVLQEITLEEAFSGAKREFEIKTHVVCSECAGLGADKKSGVKTCSVCSGAGEIREQKKTFFGDFSQVKMCEKCGGTGQVSEKPCAPCRGAGRVNGTRRISVSIAPGVQNDQIIKIAGMGEAGEKGAGTGDLYVRVKIKNHAVFKRHGDDLIISREIKVLDLLLGRKLTVRTISGGTVSVEIPANFDLKQMYKIPSEGMPHFGKSSRGDLLVDLIIKAPKKVSGHTREILEKLE